MEEDDLFAEVPVAPWEAALGGTITAPSLEGPLQLRMPPATASGQQLRVKKRGLPRIDAPGERGDLYVRMVVEMPATLSDDEKAAWQALAAVSKFNPREE